MPRAVRRCCVRTAPSTCCDPAQLFFIIATHLRCLPFINTATKCLVTLPMSAGMGFQEMAYQFMCHNAQPPTCKIWQKASLCSICFTRYVVKFRPRSAALCIALLKLVPVNKNLVSYSQYFSVHMCKFADTVVHIAHRLSRFQGQGRTVASKGKQAMLNGKVKHQSGLEGGSCLLICIL